MGRRPNLLPSQEELRRLLEYYPKTGWFFWRVDRSNIKAGAMAGCVMKVPHGNEYMVISLNNKRYLAHRIAYKWMLGEEPPSRIDHKDNNGLNNSWENLRTATHMENLWNSPVRKHSRTGLKGAKPSGKKFLSYITVNKKIIQLGTFLTAEEAHAAYCKAAKKYHGEFARTA